jgi:hypothetical protein
MKKKKVFQFKITLNDSSPKIWRRVQIPSGYTFFDLHVAIQDVMGWSDSHLHGFRVVEKESTRPIIIQYPNPEADFGFGNEELDERKEYLADYFGKITKQCVYEYDFGDGWKHTIVLEKELDSEPNIKYPKFIAGKNACPPEDCGGVWGYRDLQDILKNTKHQDHKDMLDWLGIENAREFDPTDFDPKEVIFRSPKNVLREYKRGFGI